MSTVAEKITQLLEKIDDPEIRERIEGSLGTLVGMTIEDATMFVDSVLQGDVETAHRLLVANMSGEELVEIMEQTNAMLRESRKRAAAYDAVKKALVQSAFEALVASVKAWLVL